MKLECGSGTRRRPIRRDYAAAQDAEVGIWNAEFGFRIQHRVEGWDFGLRPGCAGITCVVMTKCSCS